jgi:2-dehydro-3-deoxygluconokinase
MSRSGPVVTLGETMMLFAPEPDLRFGRALQVRMGFGGAESNFSIGLARLGHRVRWLSAVGDDPFGQRIVRTLHLKDSDMLK